MGGRGAYGTLKNSSGKSPLSQGSIDAVDAYVSGDMMWINQYLRGRGDFGELSSLEKSFIKDMDKALTGNVKDDVLYRSVDASAIFGEGVNSYDLYDALYYGAEKGSFAEKTLRKAQQAIGKEKIEQGYMSTTRSAKIAEEFGSYTGAENPIVVRIQTAKNTKGLNVTGLTKGIREAEKADPQKETILARKQKYKPVKMYAKNGHVYVDVKLY